MPDRLFDCKTCNYPKRTTCYGCVFSTWKETQPQIQIDARGVGPGQTAPIIEVQSADEIEPLRARVAAGVEKLMIAWKEGLKIPKDDDYTVFCDSFFKARDKLDWLCRELMAKGFEGCLWQHEPYPAAWGNQRGCNAWGEMVCWVCPKKIEDYWNENMPSAGGQVKQSHKGEKTIKFLETLGGLI
jgi:hypothetical protein